jgi:hypothetical protein
MYVPNRIPESSRFDLLDDQIVGENKYVLVSFRLLWRRWTLTWFIYLGAARVIFDNIECFVHLVNCSKLAIRGNTLREG